jgi:hypothetical protein
MTNPEGEGGEFVVRGIMEPISLDHPAASPIATVTRVPLAFYALSVDEAVGTTYEGADRDPVYRRWRSEGAYEPGPTCCAEGPDHVTGSIRLRKPSE